MKHWYVLRTHAKAEFKALNHVMRQGFGAYLPQYLRKRRHARRTDWVRSPMFPRYLFLSRWTSPPADGARSGPPSESRT